jgi:hypothetical protein
VKTINQLPIFAQKGREAKQHAADIAQGGDEA